MGKTALSVQTLAEDQPIRLEDACELFFANAVKPAGLRSEAKRGNLDIMRIAGKDFVTKAAIEEMKRRCLVNVNRLTYSSERKEEPKKTPDQEKSGLSRTEQYSVGQDALRLKLKKLNNGSLNTSPKNTSQSGKTPNLLKFPSPMS